MLRFRGQIRFDVADERDLDVVVEVTDTHARLISGSESLGSWCLADVVARRLVANQFAIELGSESVVFLADDPVSFAYGGVQAMAEGWARYHAKNVVMRRGAVAGARRSNEPSRLDEVRRTFDVAGPEIERVTASATPPPSDDAPGQEPEVGNGSTPLWKRVELAASEALAEPVGNGSEGAPAPPLSPGDLPEPDEHRIEPEVLTAPEDEEIADEDPVVEVDISSEAVEEAPRLSPVGAYADGHHPAETSGLRASMRSMFGRSKGPHDHSYVESTTAVGITRRVCLDCGHVSIGLQE